MSFIKRYRYEFTLLGIILLAAVLRFYKLNFQSLWYDELYTMNEADPSLSWQTFFDFYLKDEHPPGFFLLERIMFAFLGYEENIARILPAIAGVAGIYAIYLLGKELFNKKLGLIAAFFLAINGYAIYYAQEARAYTFFILLAIVSVLYFLKILKTYKTSAIVAYSICTALMLYMHYFGLFVVMAQLVLVIILWLNEKQDKKKLFVAFFCGMSLALLLYLPCFPFLYATSKIEKYWTQLLPPTFVINYYADFFGANKIIYPLLVLLPGVFYYWFFKNLRFPWRIKDEPLLLSGVVISTVLLIGFGIPYIRSILVTPMLQNRYFLFTIPFFVLIHAYAFLLIKNKVVSYSLLAALAVLLSYNHIVVKQYYTSIQKEDVRSLTSYIAKEGKSYPAVVEKSGWNHMFYLKKKGYTGRIIKGDMNKSLDSLLHSTSGEYNADTVWLEGGYPDHAPTAAKKAEFGQRYTKIKEQRYHDAWAELWVKNKFNDPGSQ